MNSDVEEEIKRLETKLAAVEQERDTYKAAVETLSKEYHAAINEPEYAGTRADWIYRALTAERERQSS